MSLKVLFITSSLYKPGHPSSTGGTISNYLLLQAMASLAELCILVVGPSASAQDDLAGAEIIRRPSPGWSGLQLLTRWNPYVQNTTKTVMSEHGPFDAVIASSNTVPALVPRVIGTTPSAVIIRAFENFGAQAPGVAKKTRKSLIKQAIIRRGIDSRVIRNASLVVTNSHYMSAAIQKRFSCKKDRIHVIVQQCKLAPDVASAAPDNVVGFVNRSADKNLSFVIEMARRTPDLEYKVYGHTPQIEEKPPNLTIMGWSNDRQHLFSSAKVWVVPSLWPEPFGRVSIEAQAADRVAIVHATGGLPETVMDKEFSLASFDHAEWETKIHKAMDMSSEKLSDNGERIRERYSAEAHDQSIVNMLEKLQSVQKKDR